MTKIAIVGCTGKLGSAIMKKAFQNPNIEICYAVARKGNPFVGKKDAPSGTALMIKNALLDANSTIDRDKVTICSIRGGNIFGEHEVIFANCKDEVVTFKHQVSSREPFADGAIEVSNWIIIQSNGLYNMDDFCNVSFENEL